MARRVKGPGLVSLVTWFHPQIPPQMIKNKQPQTLPSSTAHAPDPPEPNQGNRSQLLPATQVNLGLSSLQWDSLVS